MSSIYDLYAIRYATRSGRSSSENFIGNAWSSGGDDSDSPIDYYFWAIRNGSRTIVVDTGFTREEAAIRREATGGVWRPHFFCDPADGLRMIGIDPQTVTDVILTHLHFDHIGSLPAFPSARFHVQEEEVQYAIGRNMAHQFLNSAYSRDHIKQMVDLIYGGRVVFHNGEVNLFPGISLHPLPGHTLGLQGVRVSTARGAVMLAGDSSHFYVNFQRTAPFPIVADVTRMIGSFSKLSALADSPDHIIPGHDPLVGASYPAVSPQFGEIAYRLDQPPSYRPNTLE